MLKQGSPRRRITIFVAGAFIIMLFGVMLVRENVNLSGSAVSQRIEQDTTDGEVPAAPAAEEPAAAPEENAAPADSNNETSNEPSAEIPAPTSIPPTPVPPTAIPPTAIPTEIPPTEVPPTAIPPTEIPATAIPTTAASPTPASATVTDVPTSEPTSGATTEVNVEATEEAAIEPTSEATVEVTAAAEVTEEATAEVTAEATAEVTAEASPLLEIISACSPTGTVFTITNNGGAMQEAETYKLDDVESGTIQLAEGEVAIINGDYGSPLFSTEGMSYTPSEVCNPPGGIEGVVWMDANANGVQDGDEGIVGQVTFTLSDAEGITQEINSDETGRYLVEFLRPGIYTLVVDTPPAFSLPTFDVDGTADSSATIEVGLEVIQADFGYQELRGSVSGTIWQDANENDAIDADETGLSGVTVNLSDAAGNLLSSMISEANGQYRFDDLRVSQYVVTVDGSTLGEGWTGRGDNNRSVEITLESGLDVSGVNFGFVQQMMNSINGLVWLDLNGNAAQDANEPVSSGSQIQISSGETVLSMLTDENGRYQFSDLAEGEYTVQITDDLAGLNYRLTSGEASVQVQVPSITIDAVNFGLQPTHPATISGMVWLETGNFGIRDSGETGIAGLKIDLVDATGTIIQSFILEADGFYSFENLLGGNYSIQIDETSLPAPLYITYNTDGNNLYTIDITVQPGDVIGDIDFGLVGAF